jgi:ParB/RepB/Spo0J family partition protein
MPKAKSQLLSLSPTDIRPNEENPRIHFPDIQMDKLAESIDEVGVLVPVSVFKDPGDTAPPYVLIDGERRWRCARRLGLPDIPSIIMPPPDSTENLLKMFHIHMVRDEWDPIPTARALKKVVERTGVEDPNELSKMTGLSTGIIKQLLFAMTLPHEYQELIDSREVPLNFFYELKNHLISPLAKQRPEIYRKFGERKLLRAFVTKRLAGVTTDTVELRKLRAIINAAVQDAGGPDESSEFDDAIISLIKNRERTIQEAYEDTVEMVVEADKFSRQCQQLIGRFDLLIRKAQSEEDREIIFEALSSLRSEIDERLA